MLARLVQLSVLALLMALGAKGSAAGDATVVARFDRDGFTPVAWDYAAPDSSVIKAASKAGSFATLTYAGALASNAPVRIPLVSENERDLQSTIVHYQFYSGRMPEDLNADLPSQGDKPNDSKGFVTIPTIIVAWSKPGTIPAAVAGEVDVKQADQLIRITDQVQNLTFSPEPNRGPKNETLSPASRGSTSAGIPRVL